MDPYRRDQLGGLGLTVVGGYKKASSTSRALLIGVAAATISYLGFGLMDTMTLGAKPLAVGAANCAACLL